MSDVAGILDQYLLEDIAKNCPQEFLDYHKCRVGYNPCVEQQDNLQRCIKTKVKSFIKILNICQKQMKDYETCLSQNPQERSKCISELSAMRSCAGNVVGIKESNLGKVPGAEGVDELAEIDRSRS